MLDWGEEEDCDLLNGHILDMVEGGVNVMYLRYYLRYEWIKWDSDDPLLVERKRWEDRGYSWSWVALDW